MDLTLRPGPGRCDQRPKQVNLLGRLRYAPSKRQATGVVSITPETHGRIHVSTAKHGVLRRRLDLCDCTTASRRVAVRASLTTASEEGRSSQRDDNGSGVIEAVERAAPTTEVDEKTHRDPALRPNPIDPGADHGQARAPDPLAQPLIPRRGSTAPKNWRAGIDRCR